MFKISHLGNLCGPDPNLENKPEHIVSLLQNGVHVKIDVRTSQDGRLLFLGRDEPQYAIPESFLRSPGLWCHARDYGALQRLAALNVHYFWHEAEDLVITSQQIPWVHHKTDIKSFPSELISRSVLMFPEKSSVNRDYIKRCYAVCTNYVWSEL